MREPIGNIIRQYKQRPKRPHAVKKPKSYAIRYSGDLVQVDTLKVGPLAQAQRAYGADPVHAP